MNLRRQIRPQIMRQAYRTVVTVAAAAAARGIDDLIDRVDDVRYRDRLRRGSQAVAPTRPTHAVHQPPSPHACEQLFEVRLRDVLARSDVRQRHRLRPGHVLQLTVQGEIEKRGDRVAAASGQPHDANRRFMRPWSMQKPTKTVQFAPPPAAAHGQAVNVRMFRLRAARCA